MCMFATSEATNTETKMYAAGDTTCTGNATGTSYQYSRTNTASSKTSVYCYGYNVNIPCAANGYTKEVYTCASDGGLTVVASMGVSSDGSGTPASTGNVNITAALWTKMMAGECYTHLRSSRGWKIVNPSNLPQWCLPSTPAPTPVVAATVSLAGITLAQFDAAAKTAFKEVVATYLSICGTAGASQCTASDVTIISAARRDVAVKFEVKTSSSTKAVAGATTLNAAITTNAATFKAQLVAKGGALARVSGTVTVAAASAVTAAAGVTATPSMLVVSALAMLGMIKSM